MRILLVDDDDIVVEYIRDVLAVYACELSTLRSVDARHELVAGGVDVLIVDLIMPDVDGVELIEQARKLSSPPAIIAISGGGKASADFYLNLARAVGADLCLRKPICPEELLSAIGVAKTTREVRTS